MKKPTITEHNIETGETIQREMTDDEFNQYKIDQKVFADQELELKNKIEKKAALLKRLGINEEEASLLMESL